MSKPDSLSRLVEQASNLRDYLLHVDGEDSDVLSVALRPFERRADDATPPTDKDIRALGIAFETSHDSVIRRIDSYTIGEVLKGRAPQFRSTPVWTSAFLALVGLVLVLAAFNFTYWANRAALAVAQAEEFIEFDHFPRLSRLIEMKYYFDQVSDKAGSTDLEPQLLYLEGISALQRHYLQETTLPGTMDALLAEAAFFRAPVDTTIERVCGWEARGGIAELVQSVFGCGPAETPQPAASPPPPEGWAYLVTAWKTLSESTASGLFGWSSSVDPAKREAVAAEAAASSVFDEQFKVVNSLQNATMEVARRAAKNYYQDSRYAVRHRMQLLQEWLNAVHLWALPIVYGALGSLVYCMWRVLHPTVAPLGILYTVTRTVFASLAALTLSMLLVPSNILSAGVEINRPLVYLLAFIFGYSVEVFINTLNMINSYFLQNLTTRPRGAAK